MVISPTLARTAPRPDSARYSLLVAEDAEQVRAAQRLRHQVFAGELGAVLPASRDGLDVDRFDEHCDHLVVREDGSGEIVGTYRMLPPRAAIRAGGLYADTEFDLAALDALRPLLVETGRSCVHPDHRTGTVVSLVWAGLANYLVLTGHRYLAGCASVPLSGPGEDRGELAAGVWDRIRGAHLTPPTLRARPRRPWVAESVPGPGRAVPPPLLRGYLRLGARVCGPPAHDPDFDVADFLVLLDTATMDPRYRRHFFPDSRPGDSR